MHFLSTNVIKKIKLRGFRMPHTLIRISTEFTGDLSDALDPADF